MSIFTDRETQSSINSLSAEAQGRSVSDLFDQIERVCSDPVPLSCLLDKIVSGKCIADNIDDMFQDKKISPDINTYPYGQKTTDVFPYMHAIFRYGMRMGSLIKSLSGYAHSLNTVGGDEKTILITTDFCNPEFIDTIEDTLADVYFTGKLAVIIVLFTEYGCSNVPFYMNYRWISTAPAITSISDVIAKLGSHITYEKHKYRITGPEISRKYSIIINSVKDTKVINNVTNTSKIVKGRTARRFIEALWDFSENASMDIGSYPLDCDKYNIIFSDRDYQGLFPDDSESKKLIEIFETLIGNF